MYQALLPHREGPGNEAHNKEGDKREFTRGGGEGVYTYEGIACKWVYIATGSQHINGGQVQDI